MQHPSLFESLLQIGPDGQPQFEIALEQVYDPASRQLTFSCGMTIFSTMAVS